MEILKRLVSWSKIDRAESSIMQTITVAVSAILIAAGTVSMPGIINIQKENTAQSQLSNYAFAQQAWIAAKGFANTNYIPGQEDDSRYPREPGKKVENLSNWKYPYSFSDFSIESTTARWCYKNEYVVSATVSTGKVYTVTSSNPKAVLNSESELPITCQPGYVPDVDSIPTSPTRLAAPTTTTSALSISSSREQLSWTGVATCTAGSSPAYQIRAVVGSQASKNGAWSSSTTQSLGYLNDAHKAAGASTVFNVAAKCRDSVTGTLSNEETVTPTANRLTITG